MMFNENILSKLKKYLDRINYHLLLTIVLGEEIYFVNPLPDFQLVKQNILKLPKYYQSIVKFFLLGEPIPESVLFAELDHELIRYLCKCGITNQNGNSFCLNNFCLTSYCNCYLLVSNVYYYPTCRSNMQKPYIGIDSYWLSRIIVNRLNGRVLDLCTGSGIQAILAAKTAKEVVAVDIDKESTTIADFNACLNGVSSKIKILTGDLYNVLEKEDKFDYIISNPPFIPIPNDIAFHICGDGGEDGMAIIRRIIRGYKNHLTVNGETIMIGQCVGRFDHALIQDITESENINKEYTLYLHKRLPLENQAIGFADLATRYNGQNTSSEEWLRMYSKMHVTHFHTFTLFTKNTNGKGTVLQIDDMWTDDMVPIPRYLSMKEFSQNFSIQNSQKQTIVIDEETAVFLNMINGKESVSDIVKKMPIRYRLKYGRSGTISMQLKYAQLCSQLERQLIIDRAVTQNTLFENTVSHKRRNKNGIR